MLYNSHSIVVHLIPSESLQTVNCLFSLNKGETGGHRAVGWEGEKSQDWWEDLEVISKMPFDVEAITTEGFTFWETLAIVECINEQMTGREALDYLNEVVVFFALDLFSAFNPWWEGSTMNNQWKT